MKKILIFGSTGLLGSSLSQLLNKKKESVYTAGRHPYSDVCFSGENISEKFYEKVALIKPDVIINLIAATNVDECERNPKLAIEMNSTVPKIVASASIKCKPSPHLIHISTDQVYSGNGLHSETEVMPTNIYGKTKLEGERWIREIGGTILRTNFVGASQKKERISSTDWLIKGLKASTSLNVVKDVVFSPAHIDDVCEAIYFIINHPKSGTYNFGSFDGITKANFFIRLASELGFPLNLLKEVYLSDLGLDACRPLDMTMNVSLFEKTFGLKPPSISDVIKKCVKEYSRD